MARQEASQMTKDLERLIAIYERHDRFDEKLRSSFGWFIFIGVSLIAISCLFEILYGHGYHHPIWDKNFDWIQLLGRVMAFSAVGSLVFAYVSTYSSVRTLVQLEQYLKSAYSQFRLNLRQGYERLIVSQIILNKTTKGG